MSGERVVAVALTALLLLTVWMVDRVREAGAELAAADAVPSMTAPRATEPPPGAPPPLSPSRSAPTRENEVDVCGVGRLGGRDRHDAVAQGWQGLQALHGDAARAVLAKGLASGRDERQRAAAAWWMALQAREAAFADTAGRQGLDRESCVERPSCRDAARAAGDDAARAYTGALAQTAVSTHDPRVYAVALALCGRAGPSAPAECGLLSLAQWARLDPDNAAPWLAAAREAAASGDDAAYAEAIHRATRSRVLDDGHAAMLGVLGQPWVEAQPAPVRAAITSRWLDTVLAMPMDLPTHANAWCRDGAADANRRQLCEDLATLLLERSTSMIHLVAGRGIGRALGWSDERLAAAQREIDALHAVEFDRPDVRDPLSCERIDEFRHRLVGRERLGGEVGSAREGLVRSGLDAATLAARTREWRESVAKAAATEAASAPAAR